MKDRIKPVLRLAGSKYRKIEIIEKYFINSKCKNFYEIFGGTGIVSVNLKNKYKDINFFLNDFDDLFPLTKDKVEKNLTSYEGLGKYFTKSLIEYYKKRIKNGLWNKVEIYNNILKSIIISKEDYKNIKINTDNNFIYLDPPYFKNEKLYKNHINTKEFYDWVIKLSKNNKILISYNNDEYIKELYKEFNIIEDEFNYCGMGIKTRKNISELWITNIK